uniref:Dihydrodipicolinate synthase n=1 Tax=uncultured bacterium Contig575 TaxID=1393592 RepID=W0FHX7_9BACT|nr:dihydrodipicolinate synthase [uncultured bacterium Contig575]
MTTDNNFPGGAWPVMLTPFTEDNRVDYEGLGALIEWYIAEGVSGLFAVCQSSEMFFLSLEERVGIARYCVERAAGRVPVIASGHISDSFEDQVQELTQIGETGVDAVILITNRLASREESDAVWLENLGRLLDALPGEMRLGFYECPFPYKRVLSREMTEWCANTGRFYFLKDTSCDIGNIRDKLEVSRGTNLKLYNANAATLLESLRSGAAGYSGVMCNSQCRLYAWFTAHWDRPEAQALSDCLTVTSWMEHEYYPVNAKYYLQRHEGLPITTFCRTKDAALLTETQKGEMDVLKRVTRAIEDRFLH